MNRFIQSMFVIPLAVSLVGCSSVTTGLSGVATSPSPTVISQPAKEAGTLGTRVCLINESQVPISIATWQVLNTKNGNTAEGYSGVGAPGVEMCTSGWSAFDVPFYKYSRDMGPDNWVPQSFDVAFSVNIDGEYNALVFRANNAFISSPKLEWTTPPTTQWDAWVPWTGSEGSLADIEYKGHSFQVIRRTDSSFHKEFLIRVFS